jgi:hypothetical protein
MEILFEGVWEVLLTTTDSFLVSPPFGPEETLLETSPSAAFVDLWVQTLVSAMANQEEHVRCGGVSHS